MSSWLQWSVPTFLDNSPKAGRALALLGVGLVLVSTPSVPLFMHHPGPFVFNALLCLIVFGHQMVAIHLTTLLEERRKHRYKVLPLTQAPVEPDEPQLEYREPMRLAA